MKHTQTVSLNWIKFICACGVIIPFCYVWLLYYNDFAFQTWWIQGALVSVILYTSLYFMLARLYEAFRIETCQIGELVFSQVLALGMADAFLYIECCLVHGGVVSILPGFGVFIIQAVLSGILVFYGKQYLLNHVKPYKTLLISRVLRQNQAKKFKDKLASRLYYLFDIQDSYYCKPGQKDFLLERIEAFEAVIMYEVPANLRSRIFAYCVERQKLIYVTPRLDDIFLFGFENSHVLDTPLMRYGISVKGKREGYLSKRFWDVLLSLIMLILFSPAMLFTAICIRLEDGGPVFFKQKRCTLHGKEFDILKFRSMIPDAEKPGQVLPCKAKDARITKTGRVIRAARLDELPQLINILKGDMSVVGPRPERVEHVKKYSGEVAEFPARLQVRGGLTGYAQVFGKYNTTAEDKLKMDLMYIGNMSLWMDMKIMFLTVKTMFIPESTEGFEEEKSKESDQKTNKNNETVKTQTARKI